LAVRYDPVTGRLEGTATLGATATQGLTRFDLDLSGMQVSQVRVGGIAAGFSRDGQELVITPPATIAAGRDFSVAVDYAGVPGTITLPGVASDQSGFLHNAAGAVAAGEPQAAAFWYPVNDHPQDKATYDITVSVPTGWQAVSNGVLVDQRSAGGQDSYHWRESAPMAPYLSTMVVGHFRILRDDRSPIAVYSAVAQSLPASVVDPVLARIPELVTFLSSQFGPYPFDTVGAIVADDPDLHFALETQTRPIFAPGYFNLANPTDVVVHELAHQWYGDSVSVRWWHDIWLNEGFATYAEWLWSGHTGRNTPQQIFDSLYAQPAASTLWDPPPAAPGEQHMFGRGVYQRGAMALQALRIVVGDQAFFQILQDWAAQNRGGTADTAQFVALADQVAGHPVDALLSAWLDQPGKPAYPRS
jgi:aminopeptidase N